MVDGDACSSAPISLHVDGPFLNKTVMAISTDMMTRKPRTAAPGSMMVDQIHRDIVDPATPSQPEIVYTCACGGEGDIGVLARN